MKQKLKMYIHLISFKAILIAVLTITGIIQFLLLYDSVKGDTYSLQLTQIADETIRAVKTVEDVEKTEEARNEAEKLVEPIYSLNTEIVNQRVSFVKSVFDVVLDVKKTASNLERPIGKDERIARLKQGLKDITESQEGFVLTDGQLDSLMVANEEDLIEAKETIAELVKLKLSNAVKSDDVRLVKSSIALEVTENSSISRGILSAAVKIAETAIVENNILDVEKTKESIEQARSAVEPKKILQGQIIVREGEAVDKEMLRQLELLGMLDQKASFKPMLGLAILVLLQMSFLYIVFERFEANDAVKRKNLFVTSIVYIISLVVMFLFTLIEDHFDVLITFLYPTAMTTMLVRILANEKIASIVTVLTAASAGVIFQESYASVLQMDIALYILFGGFGALYFMRDMEKRKGLLHAVAVVTTMNAMFISFYILMAQASISFSEILFYVVAAIISGLLSGALTMGLLPFFESAFGILSVMRLIELSNPNHPLLKKILTEAPGTYHHSVMVANLAEASCEAVGADGLLARVASYYHDVGKTRRPLMFIENQISGVNPHDSFEPEKSAEIIKAHTVDGAELLREHKIPNEIVQIALQHHGTSALKFFLHKAKEQGKDLDESVFRYDGPKPQTKEAAIVSIADSVEAAVRSMKEPTPEKIQALVHAIIQDRLQDEQFDECDISIKELKKIESVLCETLNGIFHSRIEYPK